MNEIERVSGVRAAGSERKGQARTMAKCEDSARRDAGEESGGSERKGQAPVLSSRAFHLILLAVGTAFLLAGAFHGNVWFDESYSVGIANHSFAEIWRIGSGDVHPVLFYWALHVLNLVFGQNVLVYRLFALAGAVSLAALGYTHLRRDFGWRVGVLFSFLALFTPYVATMSVEIRMYSWATFTVMLCAIYAWRIFGAQRAGRVAPLHCWLVFFAASLASAYLHYYGVLAAFSVNALLLAYLLVDALRKRGGAAVAGGLDGARATRGPGRWRAVGVFFAGAAVQVALYAPWLLVLVGQMGVVSETYWAKIVFPTTYIELAMYPVMTSHVSFASRGAYGAAWQMALEVLWAAMLLWAVALVLYGGWRVVGYLRQRGSRRSATSVNSRTRFGRRLASDKVLPVLCALGVYVGASAIAFVLSDVMGSNILYYRYLFVSIGPLLLAVSLLLAQIRSRMLVGGACALMLAVSLLNQVLLVRDNYAPENRVPLERLAERAPEVDLIVSSDIGIQGVMAVTYPAIPQVYMDWQKGNWGLAYESYAPTLTSKKSWELILDDFHGRFIVLGQAQNADEPRDVADLRQKPGITMIDSQTYYRPYERTYFTIAVMEKA
ncbi:MAG: hypothetical protein RR218_07305 [Gordonibacter sp.]